jgi:glucose/mannose-6-phosphate isomerase
MIDLDNIDSQLLARLDPYGMGKIIADFPSQCRRAVEIARNADIKLPRTAYRNIVICGMGGSAIAGDILASCLAEVMPSAIFVQRNYGLPGWVGKDDLVIASSYSGETEETLSDFEEALKRKSTVAAITSGGKLKERCLSLGLPFITIPGGLPPRGALGYSFFTLLGLFKSSGLISDQAEALDETLAILGKMSGDYSADKPGRENKAKQIATDIYGYMPVVYASADLLTPAARRWANQLNENAKILSYWAAMPELCHNEIVGWEKLPDVGSKAKIIFLQDSGDHPRNNLRFDVLQGIINSESAGIIKIQSQGRSKLARMFSLLYLADYISYYLALLNEVDPMPVKRIDRLKSVLKERR